jgi:hypothetical protein
MNQTMIHKQYETDEVENVEPRANPLRIEIGEQPARDHEPLAADDQSVFSLVDLILKAPRQVDQLSRDPSRLPELLPRFLGIGLVAYSIYSLAMIVILGLAPTGALPHHFPPMPAFSWSNGTAFALWPAYTLGLVLASCICLPSFYFYSLLAGVRMSFQQVVAIILRCKSVSAMVLLGLLPIYFAVVLGMIVFKAEDKALESVLYLGLFLPFVAGLEGVLSIYHNVMGYADTLPPDRRCRRACFLRRLTVAWSAVYTAVAPVMIYRLWWFIAEKIGG